nr:hypothetical protein Q903MT_gene2459 [Picea sitchensis]
MKEMAPRCYQTTIEGGLTPRRDREVSLPQREGLTPINGRDRRNTAQDTRESKVPHPYPGKEVQ